MKLKNYLTILKIKLLEDEAVNKTKETEIGADEMVLLRYIMQFWLLENVEGFYTEELLSHDEGDNDDVVDNEDEGYVGSKYQKNLVKTYSDYRKEYYSCLDAFIDANVIESCSILHRDPVTPNTSLHYSTARRDSPWFVISKEK